MLNNIMRYVYRIEQTLDISTVFEIDNSRVCKVRQIFERLRQVLYLLLYITQGLYSVKLDPVQSYLGDIFCYFYF